MGTCACGGPWERAETPYRRHPVFELPQPRIEVTEHRLYRSRCVRCGVASPAERPVELPDGQMGPRLLAWIGVLAGRCQHLLAHETRLWTFLRAPDIPLINNAAERALRGAVLWRKASFGVWSHRGEQFRSHILSVVETCRMRGLSVIAVVQRIVAAVFARKPYPDVFGIGLLPSSQSG